VNQGEVDRLRQEVEALRREVRGLKELICLVELSSPGLRFIVRDGEKVLQHFDGLQWADVPIKINPLS